MTTELTKMVEALDKRLKILEDERAILSTLYAYAHTIDYGLKAEWVDCFTEDAIYLTQVKGTTVPQLLVAPLPGGLLQQPSGGLKGREPLVNYINTHTNAPAVWHKHFLSEPTIRLEDNKASVESYFTRLHEDINGPYILAFGRYRDKMIKCPDGRWRFQERVCEVESTRMQRL